MKIFKKLKGGEEKRKHANNLSSNGSEVSDLDRYKKYKHMFKAAEKELLAAQKERDGLNKEIDGYITSNNQLLDKLVDLVKETEEYEDSIGDLEVEDVEEPEGTNTHDDNMSKDSEALDKGSFNGYHQQKDSKNFDSQKQYSDSNSDEKGGDYPNLQFKLGHPKTTALEPKKLRKVHYYPRDENGEFIIPAQVSIFTILNLGRVEYKRSNFHTIRYIYPIGFKMQRYFKSTISATDKVCYTLTIVDAEYGPQFQMVAEDRPDHVFVSETLSGMWTQVIKQANLIRNLKATSSGSGLEFSGFTHPAIAYMIQSLKNADKCENYQWQDFDVTPSPENRRWDAPPLNDSIKKTNSSSST